MDEYTTAGAYGDGAAEEEYGDEEGVARPTEEEAQANLLAVLRLCAAGTLRCSERTRRPSAAAVTAVDKVLAAGDFYTDEAIIAFAWPLLLQAGGLAELAGGRMRLTPRGRTALGKPPAETIRHLWRRWLTHGAIDEMSRVETIKGQRAANVLTAVKRRRQTVAAALADCPPGEWVPIDDLFATMWGEGLSPTVARSERGLWKLYILDPMYGSLGYAGFHDWPILEGRYTLCVLFEYAATLGLIDVSYTDPEDARDDFHDNWGADDLACLSRYDGLDAVRLNALGAYALGATTRYEPAQRTGPADRMLEVLPNHDVVVTGTLRPADRLLLDAFATRGSDRVWSLTPATLLAGVDAGHTLDALRGFLRNRARHELPDTVATLIDDVAARTGQVRDLGPARVVECADPAVAAFIARDRTLRTLCRPLGDRHIAVPVEHDDAFRKRMRALGYVLPTAPGT
ncbi:MAG: helicase-associated domain-containing protein [Streptosporangiaceae bacterium]